MNTERELFDVDHCQAGEWLMSRMPFPPEFTEVVAHHHGAPGDGPFGLVQLIRIADRMADVLGFAVIAHPNPLDFGDVLGELPEGALVRFNCEQEELRAESESRIQAWG